MNDADVRKEVVEALLRDGYSVEVLSGGRGSPRYSRFAATKDGVRRVCYTKVTQGGRIHVPREPDGTYPALEGVDWILHAKHDDTGIDVTVFDVETLRERFDMNQRSLEGRGMGHIPSWINPDYEPGWRLVGSGFKDKALWTLRIPFQIEQKDLPLLSGGKPSQLSMPKGIPSQVGLLDQVKGLIAQHMGVPVEKIELDIRVKG